jgi:hypothetical protein
MLSLSILSSLLLHALVTHLNQLKAFFLELKVMEAATSITVQLKGVSDLGFGFIGTTDSSRKPWAKLTGQSSAAAETRSGQSSSVATRRWSAATTRSARTPIRRRMLK